MKRVYKVVKIDKSMVVPISMSRGQIFRFDLWATDDECQYNDSAIIIFSYGLSRKSTISIFRLGSGLIKKEDGKFYCEFDSSIVREIHDIVYAEFFPYGTGYKSMTFSIGLNDSAYGSTGSFIDVNNPVNNLLGHAVFNNTNVSESNQIECVPNEFTQVPLFYDPNNGIFEAGPEGFENWINNDNGRFQAQNNYDKWLMRLDLSVSQDVSNTDIYFNVNIGTDGNPIRILGTKGIKIELSSNANVVEDFFIEFTQYTLDTYKENGGKFELLCDGNVQISKVSLLSEITFNGSSI